MQNDTLILRALEPEDIDTLYIWENDITEWYSRQNMTPISRYQLWQYIKSYDGTLYGGDQLRMLVCRNDGTPVGTVDLYDIDAANRRAWVGIYIAPEWRNRDYARTALTHIAKYACNHLSIEHIAAEVADDNIPSCRLFESIGYKCAGVLHSWRYYNGCPHDIRIFQYDCI